MRRKRLGPPPFWFEEGSPFLARLSTEPRDIPHKIKALPWCGANSIFIRDKIAVELAEDLSAEHAETATRLGEIVSVQAQRLLIIRAIDDEASLVLAFSTIVNSFIIRAIRYVRWIIFGPISAIL